MPPVPPHPDAGSRLLPNIVDDVATHEPDRVIYEYPSSDNLGQPWTRITTRQYADAVNRAAHWLDRVLGVTGAGSGFPVLGYSGPPDLRYYLFAPASVKTGRVMLYTSPRNSPEGDVAVLEGAGCATWLAPSRGGSLNIQHIKEHIPHLVQVDVPDLDFFLGLTPPDSTSSSSSAAPYPYTKTWEQARRDPLWVLHTSGSTGHPKPVFRFLDSLGSAEANVLLPPIDGRPLLLHDIWSTRCYQGFPFFHAAGLNNGTLWPLIHGATIILGPSGKPTTADIVLDVIRTARPQAMYLPPSLLEDIVRDGGEEKLGALKAIGFAGGPLSREAGHRIAKYTRLRMGMGTTETGWLPAVDLEDPASDWFYIHVHPSTGNHLQSRGNGLFELVAERDPALAKWQPIFSTFPDLQTYPFRDLFSLHPTRPGLFKYEGRLDSILVLSNGEKVQPQSIELAISGHSLVQDAVVVGQGRFQTSLLVQPASPVHGDEEFIDSIWPAVAKANAVAPSHACIHRNMILVGKPDKLFARTGKGTVRKGPTIELYQAEIDALYERADTPQANGNNSGLPTVDWSSPDTLHTSLKALLLDLAKAQDIRDDDDLFSVAGLDSLQVLAVQRLVVRGLGQKRQKTAGVEVPASVIYRNPTLATLSQALWTSHGTSGSLSTDGDGANGHTKRPSAEDLLQKYTLNLPQREQPKAAPRISSDFVVILTGSTGSLGSYVLEELLQSSAVKEVWCLNRAADGGAAKYGAIVKERNGLAQTENNTRLYFRHSALADPRQLGGLTDKDYRHLREQATHIIHAQWKVDFNLAVSSFAPLIQGVQSLAAFAAEAALSPHLIFTSSVGIANSSHTSLEILEEPTTDLSAAADSTGYGQSKLVAENLLLAAAETSGIRTTIVRVGQIAGPVKPGHETGIWNEKEWFPSIIRYSQHVGKLPSTLGRVEFVDWIPVDYLATILLELGGISGTKPASGDIAGASIVHAVHPRPVQWANALLPTVQKHLASRSDVAVVSIQEWLATLIQEASQVANGPQDETAALSALKLVPFLTNIADDKEGSRRPVFSTALAVKRSPSLQALPSAGPGWAEIWLKQWGL